MIRTKFLGIGKTSSRAINAAIVLGRRIDLVDAAPATPVAATATLSMATNPTATNTVTVGPKVYTFKTVSAAVAATGTLTLATNPTAGDTITIGGQTITFGDGEGQVNIGVDAAATQATLRSWINENHLEVTMAAFASDDAVITARTAGTAGNSIATTTVLTNGDDGFAAATLGSGAAAVTANAALGEVARGADAAASRANLVNVVNSGSGHPTFTAALGSGTTIVFTAKFTGTGGNGIATTDTLASGADAFGAATSAGGVNGLAAKAGTSAIYGGYLYVATADNTWGRTQLTSV